MPITPRHQAISLFDNLKHRYIILILLCLLVGNTIVHAQLFSTSSQEFHSYGGGGSGYTTMSSSTLGGSSTMRSTSSFSTSTTISSYSTAPIHIANGSIQTAASNLNGGILADDAGLTSTSSNTGFIPTDPRRPIAPPTDAPLGLDWDAFLLLLSLALLYGFRLYRKQHTTHTTQP